jgi:lipopolysaccharide transport system ATP-binding protein
MANIKLENVSVDFPIFNATSRSLTSHILQVATGGQLDKDAKGRVQVQALDGLTFDISDGERVGLLGHNGAGKSTLLRLLSGIYFPTEGSIKIDGRVGSLIDMNLGIESEATGRENIFTRGMLLGLSKAEIRARLQEIIEFSELGDFLEMPVRTYSNGMYMRLAFSVATILRPEILLMDEWLSVGDESFADKAQARLSEVVSATKILVLATHSRQLLERICTRSIWLEHGKVVMDGPVAEVAKSYFQK